LASKLLKPVQGEGTLTIILTIIKGLLWLSAVALIVGTVSYVIKITIGKESKEALHADCHDEFMRETAIPSEGRIYFLALQPIPAEAGGGGFGEIFAEGGKIKWPTPPNSVFPLHGYRCQVTNYGNVPVFNVSISLHEVFKKANEARNGSREITLAREWPVPIGKIDIGAVNPFTFYVYNESNQYVFVWMPETASLQRNGEIKTIEVPLIHPPRLLSFVPKLVQ
jgi:hypothetical protein